jgi:diguanylate cyclase (GGDEF)-like protein
MPSPSVLSWVLLALLGGGIEYMLHLHELKAEKEKRLQAVEFAGQLRSHIDRELNAVIYLAGGLSSYLTVRHDSLDPQELENMLATLYANSRHIRNFGIAIGYRLAYVYPHEKNKEAIGLDYRRLPEQWPAVNRAIESRKAVLIENVRLVQGGTGIIYRVPVYIDDTYWGMLSTVIDSDSFLSAAFHDDGTGLFQFAVKGSKDADGQRAELWGQMGLFDDPETTLVESDNGWQFAVKPLGPSAQAVMRWLVRGLGWILAAALAFLSFLTLKHRESLSQLALIDPLTGIPNRRLLKDRLEQAMERQTRRPDSRCALMFIDLDGFKPINDDHGHRAGDAMLHALAARMRHCVRVGDTLGRWGGDEFIVLAEDMTEDDLEQLARRLRAAIEAPVDYHGHPLKVGASIGWATSPADAQIPQELIRIADLRMYENKRRRKGAKA